MLREILKCLFQKVQGFQPSSRPSLQHRWSAAGKSRFAGQIQTSLIAGHGERLQDRFYPYFRRMRWKLSRVPARRAAAGFGFLQVSDETLQALQCSGPGRLLEGSGASRPVFWRAALCCGRSSPWHRLRHCRAQKGHGPSQMFFSSSALHRRAATIERGRPDERLGAAVSWRAAAGPTSVGARLPLIVTNAEQEGPSPCDAKGEGPVPAAPAGCLLAGIPPCQAPAWPGTRRPAWKANRPFRAPCSSSQPRRCSSSPSR
jgi:hypothetical protein